eukprot:548493-Rhodomonas_salina.1
MPSLHIAPAASNCEALSPLASVPAAATVKPCRTQLQPPPAASPRATALNVRAPHPQVHACQTDDDDGPSRRSRQATAPPPSCASTSAHTPASGPRTSHRAFTSRIRWERGRAREMRSSGGRDRALDGGGVEDVGDGARVRALGAPDVGKGERGVEDGDRGRRVGDGEHADLARGGGDGHVERGVEPGGLVRVGSQHLLHGLGRRRLQHLRHLQVPRRRGAGHAGHHV